MVAAKEPAKERPQEIRVLPKAEEEKQAPEVVKEVNKEEKKVEVKREEKRQEP